MNLDRIKKNLIERKFLLLIHSFLFLCIILCLIEFSAEYSIDMFLFRNHYLGGIITIICYFCSALCIVIYDEEKIHIIALFIIITYGILIVFIMPILDSPDEPTHFNRAELTSRLNLVPVTSSESTYEILSSVIDLQNSNQLSVINSVEDEKSINYTYSNLSINVAAGNIFIGYVFSAIGINLAKSLNLNVIWMLWIGRLFNLIVYSIISSVAIWQTPKFKVQFLIVSTIPMAIFQAASISTDGFVYSLSFFAIALFLKLLDAAQYSVSIKKTIPFIVSIIVVGLLKLPYFLLVLLIFCVPKEKFSFKKSMIVRVGFVFGCLAIALIWYYITTKIYIPQNNQLEYLSKKNISTLSQLIFCLKNPLQFLKIVFLSILNDFQIRLYGFFSFGWLEYSIPKIVPIYFLYFGISTLLIPVEMRLKWKERLGVIIIAFLVVFTFYSVLYISWTPVGSNIVEGIQSRYFIPLLLLFPIGLYLNPNKLNVNLNLYCISMVPLFIISSIIQTILYKY